MGDETSEERPDTYQAVDEEQIAREAGQPQRRGSARGLTTAAALVRKIQLRHPAEVHNAGWMYGLFNFVTGCLSITVMSAIALISHEPFIFPSLGPTAFLFFYRPMEPSASPRNTIIGHLIGVAAGWVSLAVFGLLDEGVAMTTGITAARVGAAALSLGLTNGLMILLRTPHPPAGATTLIVSLGILHTAEDLSILMGAVVLLTIQAWIINRLVGLPYPYWSNSLHRGGDHAR